MKIKELLRKYIEDPYNGRSNYDLGLYYYNIDQSASAISFFLRSAEWGDDYNLTYESLIMIGLCLNKQGSRDTSESGAYLQAIRFDPNRPEAYYFISRLFERKKQWTECNVYSTLSFGLSHNAKPTIYDFGWKPYKSIFQRALSYWWIGELELSKNLFLELLNNHEEDLDDEHKNVTLNNLSFINKLET